MKRFLMNGVAAIIVANVIGLGGGAIAQNDNRGGLDTIVVTATKADERDSQDVGISLQAIDEAALTRKGASDFREYAEGLGSVSFADRGPGQQLIAIRGVNSSTTVVNTDEPEAQAAVGVYIDETNVALAGYNPDLELFDINRIEVLRGPQGTLYGSGSLSGAIRIITNEPDLSEFGAKTSLTYSNTLGEGESNYSVNGVVNVPIVEDVLALRVTGTVKRDGGFIDNVAPLTDARHPLFGTRTETDPEVENINTNDTFNVRGQLRYAPTESLDLVFKLIRQESDLGGTQSEDTFAPGEPLPGNNTANALLNDFEQSRTNPEPFFDEFTLYSLEGDWEIGAGATITSVTSYLDRFQTNDIESTDFLPGLIGTGFDTSTVILRNSTDVQDFVQEVRINGDLWDGRVSYIGGFFYNQQDKVFIQDLPSQNLTADAQAFGVADICEFFAGAGNTCPALEGALGIPFNPENIFESTSTFDTRQIAFFGEIAIDITETLRIIGGGRYYDYRQDFNFGEIGGAFTSGVTVDNRLEEDGFTPKASLEYRPDDDLLFYATASQGFRLGGNNDPVPIALCGANAQDFGSDSLWSYEVGAKTEFSDRVRLNGAAYYTDWDDVPISDTLNGCGFKQTVNAGNVEIYGVEGDATIVVADGLVATLSASYTDAQFTDDVAGLVIPFIVTADDALPIVPEFVFGGDLTYRFPLGASEQYEGLFNINGNYRSSQFNQPASTGGVELDGYGEVNVNLGVQTDQWSISVFVKNLTNARNVLFKDTIFLGENRDTVNRPRTLGVTLTGAFN